MPKEQLKTVESHDKSRQEVLIKSDPVEASEKLLDRIEVRKINQQPDAVLSVTRFSYRKNTSGQMHYHLRGTEVLVGIEGLLFVHLLKTSDVKCLKPGDHLTIPPGPEHAHRVFSTGRPVVFLQVLDDPKTVICEVQEESWLK